MLAAQTPRPSGSTRMQQHTQAHKLLAAEGYSLATQGHTSPPCTQHRGLDGIFMPLQVRHEDFILYIESFDGGIAGPAVTGIGMKLATLTQGPLHGGPKAAAQWPRSFHFDRNSQRWQGGVPYQSEGIRTPPSRPTSSQFRLRHMRPLCHP